MHLIHTLCCSRVRVILHPSLWGSLISKGWVSACMWLSQFTLHTLFSCVTGKVFIWGVSGFHLWAEGELLLLRVVIFGVNWNVTSLQKELDTTKYGKNKFMLERGLETENQRAAAIRDFERAVDRVRNNVRPFFFCPRYVLLHMLLTAPCWLHVKYLLASFILL